MGINTIGSCDCRCGEECADCCNDHAPSSFDVDIFIEDNLCDICEAHISGTYNVTPSAEYDCVWEYEWSGSIDQNCLGSPFGALTYLKVAVTIFCFSASIRDVSVVLDYTITRVGINYSTTYTWVNSYSPYGEFVCDEASAEAIGGQSGTPTVIGECKNIATATCDLTAVP